MGGRKGGGGGQTVTMVTFINLVSLRKSAPFPRHFLPPCLRQLLGLAASANYRRRKRLQHAWLIAHYIT